MAYVHINIHIYIKLHTHVIGEKTYFRCIFQDFWKVSSEVFHEQYTLLLNRCWPLWLRLCRRNLPYRHSTQFQRRYGWLTLVRGFICVKRVLDLYNQLQQWFLILAAVTETHTNLSRSIMLQASRARKLNLSAVPSLEGSRSVSLAVLSWGPLVQGCRASTKP